MKKINNLLSLFLILTICMPILAYAAPPQNKTNVSLTGSTTFTESVSEKGKTYSSSKKSENALLVSNGVSTITDATVTKSGDDSGDEADFYGTNAAIMCYNGATLNIEGGEVTTTGVHANAIFAYGNGVINAKNVTINTSKNNSGGIMVTGGGTLNANNLTVNTKGNSSAAIRSDRGGGTITVDGGTYTTSGTGSPSIYSTAEIIVNDATLKSEKSEGVVVEGANKVKLNNVTLDDNNTTLNGNSETYKNIFLYQSMSGDAESGEAKFTSINSKITTNKGDTFFVTNTKATIDLENNEIVNNDSGGLIRIQKGKWGKDGSNGGDVTLSFSNQKADGDVIVDSLSTLYLNMNEKSVLKGAIDSDNQAKYIYLTISSDSFLVLSADSYVDELSNGVSDNSNIYLNGHKLYVNGKEVSANNGTYTEKIDEEESREDEKVEDKKQSNILFYAIVAVIILFIVGATIFYFIRKNKIKQESQN